jgi:hypothetical protein
MVKSSLEQLRFASHGKPDRTFKRGRERLDRLRLRLGLAA